MKTQTELCGRASRELRTEDRLVPLDIDTCALTPADGTTFKVKRVRYGARPYATYFESLAEIIHLALAEVDPVPAVHTPLARIPQAPWLASRKFELAEVVNEGHLWHAAVTREAIGDVQGGMEETLDLACHLIKLYWLLAPQCNDDGHKDSTVQLLLLVHVIRIAVVDRESVVALWVSFRVMIPFERE